MVNDLALCAPLVAAAQPSLTGGAARAMLVEAIV
jgi:hypothetical protein